MTFKLGSLLDDHQKRLMSCFTLKECQDAIDILQKRVDQLSNKDYQTWLTKSIHDIGLSNRAIYSLLPANIKTMGDILAWGIDRIYLIKGCGQQTTKEIKDAVLKDMAMAEIKNK